MNILSFSLSFSLLSDLRLLCTFYSPPFALSLIETIDVLGRLLEVVLLPFNLFK